MLLGSAGNGTPGDIEPPFPPLLSLASNDLAYKRRPPSFPVLDALGLQADEERTDF